MYFNNMQEKHTIIDLDLYISYDNFKTVPYSMTGRLIELLADILRGENFQIILGFLNMSFVSQALFN